MAKRLLALALLQACTVGAAGRIEAMYEGRGGHVAGSVVPATGGAGIANAGGGDVAHERGVFGLVGIGGGWGAGHPFLEVSIQAIDVAGEGGGVGFAGGIRTRVDRSCVRWSFGAGVVALVAQLRAENRVDQFGPNPRVTRVYHDLTALAGYTTCDSGTGFAGHLGLAYELGVAELLFAPGP